jgi:RNA polymerase sigma factor (sigma-70 family)
MVIKSKVEKSQAEKNFGLTPEQFDLLVTKLREGDHSLYETVFMQHFQSCINYVMFRCKAEYTDAYDASMDAMLNLCRRIKQGKIQYGNLRYLFTRVACEHYRLRSKSEIKLEPLEMTIVNKALEQLPDDTLELLGEALKKVKPPCQTLLRSFYFDQKSLKELAALAGRTEVALRKQKQRCLAGLRSLFMNIYQA